MSNEGRKPYERDKVKRINREIRDKAIKWMGELNDNESTRTSPITREKEETLADNFHSQQERIAEMAFEFARNRGESPISSGFYAFEVGREFDSLRVAAITNHAETNYVSFIEFTKNGIHDGSPIGFDTKYCLMLTEGVGQKAVDSFYLFDPSGKSAKISKKGLGIVDGFGEKMLRGPLNDLDLSIVTSALKQLSRHFEGLLQRQADASTTESNLA